jgi:hypothetical protein
VLIKDFDIVTSDPFEPAYVCPTYGPRFHWKFMGRAIDVFYESDPGPRMQTIEARVERIKWLATKYPDRQTKYQDLLDRYARLLNPGQVVASPKSCQHRGDQVATITCDQCGQGKGQAKPVYACAIHGRCTQRLERRGQESQDPPVRTCIGCPDGPWAQ